MIVRTSRSARHVIVRLENGESIPESLAAIARSHEVVVGRVRGTGVVESVAIANFDEDRIADGDAQVLTGAMDLVSFEGTLEFAAGTASVRLHAMLARKTARGTELLGGVLLAARAVTVDLTIECWDEITAGANPGIAAPASAGFPAASTARRATTMPMAVLTEQQAIARTEEPPRNLADAARALDAAVALAMPDGHARLEREEPEAGDMLEHPSFGIVEFEAEADGGKIRIRLPTGSRREIMIDVFDVIQRESREGKRLFSLRPRRR